MHTCRPPQSHFKVKRECMLSQSPAVVRLALVGLRGRSPSTWELVVAFYPPSSLSPLHSSLPSHLIFRHKSLPIEPAEGSWHMPRRRNHYSCRSVTYANMFTHEGILSKENLPHANPLHVCHVAPVSRSLMQEITG